MSPSGLSICGRSGVTSGLRARAGEPACSHGRPGSVLPRARPLRWLRPGTFAAGAACSPSEGWRKTAVDRAAQPAEPAGGRRQGNEVALRDARGTARGTRRGTASVGTDPCDVVDAPGDDAVERDGHREERVRDAGVAPVEEAGSGRRGRRPDRRGDRRAGSSRGFRQRASSSHISRTQRHDLASRRRSSLGQVCELVEHRLDLRRQQPRAGGRAPRARRRSATSPMRSIWTPRTAGGRRASASGRALPRSARGASCPASSISIQPRSRSTASGGGTQSGRRGARSSTSAASWRSAGAFALKNTSRSSSGPESPSTRVDVQLVEGPDRAPARAGRAAPRSRRPPLRATPDPSSSDMTRTASRRASRGRSG